MNKWLKALALMLFTVVAISACGRNHTAEPPSSALEIRPTFADREPEIVTILAPELFREILRMGSRSMFHDFHEQERYFRMELTTYHPMRRDEVMTRLSVMLMAGQGYDIIFLEPNLSLFNLAQSGFIEDIFTLIDQCPHTSREDFFLNALEPFTFDGALYAFPLSTMPGFVGISADLPQEFLDRFDAYDTVTYTHLINMYFDLMYQHESEFGHLLIAAHPLLHSLDYLLFGILSSFVDFDNGISHLDDSRFVSTLSTLSQMQPYLARPEISSRWYLNWDHPANRTVGSSTARQPVRPGRYMFNINDVTALPRYSLIPERNPAFIHHKLITNEMGALYVNLGPTEWPVAAITRSGNSALAWEFIRHLYSAGDQVDFIPGRPLDVMVGNSRAPIGRFTMAIPIARDLFYPHYERIFDNASQDFVAGFMETRAGREQAMEWLTEISEMPVAPVPMIPLAVVEDAFEMLMNGILTPEEAAQRMHNAVSLWLMESGR